MPDTSSKHRLKEDIGKLPTGYKELADRFIEAIDNQSVSLKTSFKKLTSAVETLKQQPPSTDKKTAFWDAYKTLADEFDKEFQRKYGNDLDTSLIFAGLFSAVSSAFIILIQPEFQPDPNATTQALLGLLVQNITGAAIPVDLIPQSRAPLQIVVVAQALLYFSLLSTLLAALLAVQGKECLLYYDSVGKRGTIAERGLERQRKFDGLRRWKFDLAMQVFPLLLQLALLLFALALSIYLWTIHHVIAGIVLVLTGLGSIGYAMMTITSMTWEDSPFQTSLGFLLKTLLKTTPVANSPPKPSSEFHHKDFPSLSQEVRLTCNRALAKIKPLLPLFNSPKHQDSAVPIFEPPPPPSEEISAVIWVLETSTNPVIVASAAEMIPQLDWWPVTLDVRPAMKRLNDIFDSCCTHCRDILPEDKVTQAIACLKAFAMLEMVTEEHQQLSWSGSLPQFSPSNVELQSLLGFFRVFRISTGSPDVWTVLEEEPWTITPWILRFIAAKKSPESLLRTVLTCFHPTNIGASIEYAPTILTDFLFCLNSFFSPTVARDRCVSDKRGYEVLLITHLFENINKHFADNSPMDPDIANSMILRVAQLSESVGSSHFRNLNSQCVNAAYRFCATPGLPLEVITSALLLVRLHVSEMDFGFSSIRSDTHNVEWVYRTLESLQSSGPTEEYCNIVADLLQTLFLCQPIQNKPTATNLSTIISALSLKTFADIYENNEQYDRLKCAMAAVLSIAEDWFSDEELGSMLAKDQVWFNLGGLKWNTFYYTVLGDRLCHIPQWKQIIAQDLPGWISQYPRIMIAKPSPFSIIQCNKFKAVLSCVWGKEVIGATQDEQVLATMFTALTNCWSQVDFPNGEVVWNRYHFRLLDCTVDIAFCARKLGYEILQHPSRPLRETLMVRLGAAIVQVGERVVYKSISDARLKKAVKAALQITGEFLANLGQTITVELRNPPKFEHDASELAHWIRLEATFSDALFNLRETWERAVGVRSSGKKLLQKFGGSLEPD